MGGTILQWILRKLKIGIFHVRKTPGMSWCKNGVFHECFGDGLEPAA